MDLLLLLFSAVLALLGIKMVVTARLTRGAFMKAAEYAGYTYDLFAQGKTPSHQELLDGIRRQSDRLAQQAKFLALRVQSVRAGADTTTLENSYESLKAYLDACERERVGRKSFAPIRALALRAAHFASQDWCPPSLAQQLNSWATDTLRWTIISRRLVWYLKKRIEEDARSR